MCRVENNYIPPGPEQYDMLTEYINTGILLEYLDEQEVPRIIQGILKAIEVNNYAEYFKFDDLAIRIDKVISVNKLA